MADERISEKAFIRKWHIYLFYNNKRMNDVFQVDFDIKRILMNLNIETGVAITPEDTLIILDEIQEAPKVLESLKYFCEEAPEYHIVAAGSLLVWQFMMVCPIRLER